MIGSLELGVCSTACNDEVESSLLAGEHVLFVEGDLEAGRRWFDAGYREAERLRDGEGMARASLGLGGLWLHEQRTAAGAAAVRERQRDALRMIDPGSALALRLRARLAAEDDFVVGEHSTIMPVVAEARRMDDPVALAETLSLAHGCVMGPDHGALRLVLAQELIGQGSRTSRRIDLLMGVLWHTVDLFLNADPYAERRLRELRGLLAHDGHLAIGFVVSAIETMLSIRSGRFEEAETLAASCAELGTAAGDIDVTGWYASQLGTIRWYQGRVAELVPMLSELVNSPVLSVVDGFSFAGLSVAAATAGDHRLAAGTLARLRGRHLSDLPRSSSWLTSMYGVVEAAHLLGDTETSAEAYALLRPFARLPVMSSLGVACLGSVHHCLGVASLTAGDPDRAVGHLRDAVRDNLALGHWPAVVLSRSRLGQALILADGARNDEARRELALAAKEAVTLGMCPPTGSDRSSTSLSAPTELGPAVAHRRGRRWLIELGGRSASVDHSVGIQHLATLLANPGYEIAATDLAAGPVLPGTATVPDAATQPVLDDQAKREYKQRLAQLQTEIDEFEATNELERAATVRAERDWLITELASAAGMGGRPRRFADSDERARIAVGKAIRRALKRIVEADPVIGDYLQATVQTGLRCCYRP